MAHANAIFLSLLSGAALLLALAPGCSNNNAPTPQAAITWTVSPGSNSSTVCGAVNDTWQIGNPDGEPHRDCHERLQPKRGPHHGELRRGAKRELVQCHRERPIRERGVAHDQRHDHHRVGRQTRAIDGHGRRSTTTKGSSPICPSPTAPSRSRRTRTWGSPRAASGASSTARKRQHRDGHELRRERGVPLRELRAVARAAALSSS